jgi:hypothetical protein
MDWREICLKVHNEGLQKLSKNGSIPFLLRAYSYSGTPILEDLVFPAGVNDATRMILKTMVPYTFSKVHLQVALMQSDARAVDGHKFASLFGISKEISVEEYEKEYTRILHEKFEDTVANLPSELWADILITCIKGPLVMPISFITYYQKSTEGKIELEPVKEEAQFSLGLLPDWWEETIN